MFSKGMKTIFAGEVKQSRYFCVLLFFFIYIILVFMNFIRFVVKYLIIFLRVKKVPHVRYLFLWQQGKIKTVFLLSELMGERLT